MSVLALALVTAAVSLVNAQSWSIAQDLQGNSFFNGFRFNESVIDYNNFGNVHFLSQSAASQAGLFSVDSNQHAIIKVDNTTSAIGDPTFGRNTVYLIGNTALNLGSLVIFDANHIPYGCSVWPGFFTQGAKWPEEGEIDIVENVNLATFNQYSLHTATTCNQAEGATQFGRTTNTNCTVVPELNQNTGCVVQETKPNSFGSSFAQARGGVFAMQWDKDGVRNWFWTRTEVPSDITSTNDHPDPTKWGIPSAFYPASGCDPKTTFGPQFLTLYINLCGAFAGNDNVFASTCGSVAPNCSVLVPDAANYANAYWDINYLRVFTDGTTPSPSSTGSSGASNPTNTGGANSPTNTGTGSGNTGGASLSASVKDMFFVPVAAAVFGLLAMI
ncbi:hypothetical protein BXZ70DRAFT_993891 [Cristinia sonorae]|uniref:GH16 domain-containing protein n=1 Tax=Cristinia sonorae TaxID=1940300 RepID=A0A8K0UJK0_9AGAR|nr:hypothetical protein BXZ70DRAFT_993891 [Cristinia sonorae]